MDSNSVMTLMDVVVLGAGLYVLYGYYLMMTKGEIKAGLLVPKEFETKKCKDLEGFRRYMGPRSLLLGTSAVISGGIGIYQDFVKPINQIVYWVFFAAFLAIIIWFAVASRKAQKDFY